MLFLVTQVSYSQAYEKRLASLEDKAYEYFYTNKDSTYYYFNEITKLALAHKKVSTAIDNLNYVCFSAGYFYDMEKIQTTIELADELIKKHSSALDSLSDHGEFQKNYLNFNKGIYYHKLEDFVKAESYFNAIAKKIVLKPNYQENIDDLEILSQCYSFIAQMNVLQKKYEIANDYFEKNIRLYKRHIPQDLEGLYKVYNLYANSLYKEERYDEAKKLWIISFEENQKNYSDRNRNSIVTTALLLSKVYRSLNKIDSAAFYLNKVNKYKIEADPFEARYLIAKGEIHLKETNYLLALETFTDALGISRKNNKPRLRKKIGDLYIETANYEKALASYQKGIVDLSSEFSATVLATNPDPSTILQKNTFLSLLAAKAKTLGRMKDSTSKISALGSVNTGLATLDLLKPSFKNQIDKLGLIEDTFSIFETGIETAYQLNEIGENTTYIDIVFEYSEKSKSAILLDALLSSKATEFSNIPNNLLEKEKQLKTQISYLEKQLFESDSDSESKFDEIFELKQDYISLIKKFENEYPSYYELRYDTQVTTLAAVQDVISNNEILISYFYGSDAIYAIGIGKNSKQIHRIPLKNDFENSIKQVHQMLADSKSEVTALGEVSYKLYQKLISPFMTSSEKKKLIIIPDGLLNYIPFGALNTEENGLSYLMEHHAISYVNSATLYAQLIGRDKKSGELLAFAPKFSGEQIDINPTRDKLLPLPHNSREVEQILSSFTGQSYVNENASLQNFTSQLSNYSILHLATHAVFNDTAPEYSYLAFSSSNTKESLLYVSDLYNLKIDADLVTLSACESGVGELKRGEGFLSLARGFFYSGASSIASTLWKINDASTTTLMDSFYENLADGESKDLALQKAKINFLAENRQNGLAHPYYWSAFIISGNTEALIAPNYWKWIGLGVLLAIVSWYFLYRKKLN